MKAKSVYFCTECGNEYPKWMGKCPSCGSWNTLVEQIIQPTKTKVSTKINSEKINKISRIDKLDTIEEIRFDTGMSELDRVLGGGAVKGSLVLVGGAPGIGKSTLLLQICEYIGKDHNILYITGEESVRQLKMRADRLGVNCENLYVFAETDLADIIESVESTSPDVLIIDSIQTMYNRELNSAPGSVSQVKECTLALMQLAKGQGITIFVVGHVNKEGAIAGPKVLEHMVDCVLYFEGDEYSNFRILRAAKNRFGSTNEIGVFEMTSSGLNEVPNPSEMLLSGRPENTPGTCVACIMEGSRPILSEIQALLTPSSLNVPRRNSNGVDFNRFMLLMAVLEKRGGLRLGGCDAYINVIGGLNLNEPAADLAAALAIASSYRDRQIPDDLTAIGEIGLTGEIRMVSNMSQRLGEIARLGFKQCIIPKQTIRNIECPEDLKIIKVKTIIEALDILL
jgi:DNA repair protein RadA/Sms